MEFLKNPDWHLLIVWYFFIGGIAGGAYFTAAIADNFGGPRDRSVVRIGYTLALLLIGLCGILLILDLGTPSRFLNMLGSLQVLGSHVHRGLDAGRVRRLRLRLVRARLVRRGGHGAAAPQA